jgi:hypothetical protein
VNPRNHWGTPEPSPLCLKATRYSCSISQDPMPLAVSQLSPIWVLRPELPSPLLTSCTTSVIDLYDFRSLLFSSPRKWAFHCPLKPQASANSKKQVQEGSESGGTCFPLAAHLVVHMVHIHVLESKVTQVTKSHPNTEPLPLAEWYSLTANHVL